MQAWLGFAPELRDKVTHDVEHAALRAPARMRQIVIIEVCTVVERDGDSAWSATSACFQVRHHVFKASDAKPQAMQQPQIVKESDVIVGRVIVAFNPGGMISQYRNGHGGCCSGERRMNL